MFATPPTEYATTASVDVLNKVAIEAVLGRLTDEEREIIELWIWHDLNFDEIGEIVGQKYRGRPLTGSAIRYHKNRVLRHLRTLLGETPE
jgi:DNA-directed RNA polymerase specialized sigma24 family protein